MLGGRRPDSAVESWLAGLVRRALGECLPGVPVTVTSVDLAGPLRLGGFRAFLDGPAEAVGSHAARVRVAKALATHPDVDSAAAVHDRICFAPSAAALVDAAVHCAGRTRHSAPDEPGVVVVFCSPNTNKPLHLGHLRACFLGASLARVVAAATGRRVATSQMLSNFGVHVCQALATEERCGVREPAGKGDHHVGALYRDYHRALAGATCDDPAHVDAGEPTGCLACRPQQMLRQMVAGDERLRAASTRLTEWAIDGIHETQRRVGAAYDAELRESLSLPTAYAAIDAAVARGVVRHRPDGSAYVALREAGDAELTLLRRDGTALVFAMLLGIYLDRYARYPGWDTVELTGEHWRAGRLAMYELLGRLGRTDIVERTEGVFFGMVRRDGAVMQSRAGTVVLADDLLDDMADRAGRWDEVADLVDVAAAREEVGVAVLKYAVLGVPRANPVDYDAAALWDGGATAYAAVLRALARAEGRDGTTGTRAVGARAERDLALALARAETVTWRAMEERDPSVLVRYADQLCEQGHALFAGGGAAALRAPFARVVRGVLDLLGVSVPGPGSRPAAAGAQAVTVRR